MDYDIIDNILKGRMKTLLNLRCTKVQTLTKLNLMHMSHRLYMEADGR